MAEQRKILWEPVARITFIAWNDFCVENGIDFNKDIHTKLLEATGKEFSESQICNYFSYLSREYREPRGSEQVQTPISQENPAQNNLRKSGSVVLQGLSAEQKANILATKEKFRLTYTKDPLKHGDRSSDVEGMKRKKKVRGKKRPADDEDTDYIQKNMRQSNLPSDNISQTPEPRHMNKASTRPKDDSTYPHNPTAQDISRKRLKIGEDGVVGLPLKGKNSAPDQNLLRQLKAKDAQLIKLRAEWRQEVDEGLEREERLKKTEQNLRNDNRHLEIARDERQRAGRDPLEDMIYLKNREIWFLTKRVQETECLCKYVRFDTEERPTLEQAEVAEAMRIICSELDSILNGHIQHGPVIIPVLNSWTDLSELVRSILGPDSEPAQQKLELGRWIRGFRLGVVIKTLTAAALKAWVFDNSFFQFPASETPLLRSYREIILTLGGWKGLHGMELAAHQKLIRSPRFKTETVPKEAEKLAVRLSSALSPLFLPAAERSTSTAFEPWGQPNDVAETRQFRFQQIFEAGLLLRASTILTDDRYEFAVYRTGKRGSIDDLVVGSSGSLSQTWHLASFSVYPPSRAGSGDKLTDALRQSKNFFPASSLKEDPRSYTEHLLIPNHESSFIILGDSEFRSPNEERQPHIRLLPIIEQNDHGISSHSATEVNSSKSTKAQAVSHDSGRTRRLSSKANETALYAETRDSTAGELEIGSNERPELMCKVCGKQFSCVHNVQRHLDNLSCCRCLPCGVIFGNDKEKCRQHIENVHSTVKTQGRINKKKNPKSQHDPLPLLERDKSIISTSTARQSSNDSGDKSSSALNPNAVEMEALSKLKRCRRCDTDLTVEALVTHHGGGCHPCPSCQERTQGEEDQNKHIREAHPTSTGTNRDKEVSIITTRKNFSSEEESTDVSEQHRESEGIKTPDKSSATTQCKQIQKPIALE